jgi:hypothetical protein
MIPVTFTLEGQEEVVKRFVEKTDRVRKAILKEMRAMGKELATDAASRAPRGPGEHKRFPWHLADEIASRVKLNTPEAVKIEVRPRRRAFWGLFVETGVSTITKTPREYIRRQSRAAVSENAYIAARATHMAYRHGRAGKPDLEGKRMGYVVNTRGHPLNLRARPFMAPARLAAEAKFASRIQAAIDKAMAE